MEDQEPVNKTVANIQATTTHWLPLVTNSHASVQSIDAQPKQPKLHAYSDLQNPPQNLNQVLYLDAHILYIYDTLEDLLHLHAVFTYQPSFHKLLTYIFKLDPDISPYPAMHDLINSIENSDDIFVHNTKRN